ncbi:MAG: hypothetical protein ACTHJR_16285 [Sphingomonas sp.]|uniref:hypothetical protein n=1 Tax=Sphingomonas sp. TaxID=28214 RepID=UPI003F7FECD0
MPYPRAHYYVLIVIAVIAAGFWPSYFSVLDSSPWQFHAHGVIASLWVVMVAAQSWTAHDKARLSLHRAVGKTSLILFPFLIAGLFAIIDRTAKGYVTNDDPVRMMFGGAFVIGMAVAATAYVTVYYRALKYRRKIWVHSGYLLTTPLILFESPFGRILNRFVEPFVVHGPPDFGRILTAILWSMALELAFIAAVWVKYRQKAAPFLVAGGFIVAQMVTMGLLNDLPILKVVLDIIGHTPGALVWLTGFAIGALTSWAGWQAGKRPTVPIAAAAQPA